MLPLAYASIFAGTLLLIAGLTASTVPSVAKGQPDRANAAPAGAASSASSPASSAPGGQLGTPDARGLVHPLPGFTKGRTDQGVDYSGKPGQPILALAPGRVIGVIGNWYRGQPFLWYEVTEGVLKGRFIYIAEQITPLVKPGQSFAAGQQIARYAPSGSAIETGFATRNGRTLAQATTGYSEGQETAAGRAFRELLERL
jgi:murein DD-endopeptidase MepM/ murein hydrolase activator NlpD